MLSSSFRVDEASELIEPALERLADIDDQEALGWLKSYAASVRVRRNEHVSALPLIEEALDTAEHLGLMELLARTLLTKSSALNSVGRLRESLSLALATRDISGEFGFTEMQLRGYNNVATLYADLDVRRSLELNMEAIALARRSGQRSALLQLTSNAGYTGFMAGEWDAVLPPMEAVLQEDLSQRDRLQVLNNVIIIRAGLGHDVSDEMATLENTASEMSGSLVQSFLDDPAANQALAQGDDARASDFYSAMYVLKRLDRGRVRVPSVSGGGVGRRRCEGRDPPTRVRENWRHGQHARRPLLCAEGRDRRPRRSDGRVGESFPRLNSKLACHRRRLGRGARRNHDGAAA